MQEAPLTEEDRAWLNEPVTAQIEPDNQSWLDAMLTMRKEELITYAVYNYQIPRGAAENITRDQLIQMVIVTNKAGGGAAASSQVHKYLPELLDIIAPAVEVRDQPLYLTRGEGDAMEVFDKTYKNDLGEVVGQWVSYRKALNGSKAERTGSEAAGKIAAQSTPQATTPPPAATQPAGISLDIILPGIDNLKREQVDEIAGSIGIDDAAAKNEDGSPKYSKKQVIDLIKQKHEESK